MNHLKSILLLIFFNYYTTQSISSPWYLNAIKYAPFSYQQKCQLINVVQQVKKTSLIARSLVSAKNSTELKNDIKHKKTALKNQYLNKEKRILQKLGSSLGFTKHEWNECLQTITDMKKIATPKNINLIPHKTNNDKPQTFAAAHITFSYNYEPKETFFIQHPRITHNIILYEQIFKESLSNQLAFFAHEIEHLCNYHTLTLVIIEQYLQHYKHQGKATLEQNKDFQQLKTVYEEQAEIFAALKDAHVAQALVNLRCIKWYPNCLDETHYYHLVEINNAWKLLK